MSAAVLKVRTMASLHIGNPARPRAEMSSKPARLAVAAFDRPDGETDHDLLRS